MNPRPSRHLSTLETCQRGLYVLLFLVIYSVAELAWFLIALFQFVHTLLYGAPHAPLRGFAQDLCAYLYAVLAYIAAVEEKRPWPFAPWP